MRDVLLFNKKNFKEFILSNEKISTNILTNRLLKLVELGLLESCNDPTNKLIKNYMPTEFGKSLKPLLMSMADWSILNVLDTYCYDDFQN